MPRAEGGLCPWWYLVLTDLKVKKKPVLMRYEHTLLEGNLASLWTSGHLRL
jgi:hypothetical protein